MCGKLNKIHLNVETTFETPVFNEWRCFQGSKVRQELQVVQLAGLDADVTKDALGALCQVKHSGT